MYRVHGLPRFWKLSLRMDLQTPPRQTRFFQVHAQLMTAQLRSQSLLTPCPRLCLTLLPCQILLPHTPLVLVLAQQCETMWLLDGPDSHFLILCCMLLHSSANQLNVLLNNCINYYLITFSNYESHSFVIECIF